MTEFLNSIECVSILKAMADPTRLRLLRRLVGGEKNVSQLVKELGLDQPTVSHHLSILRKAGLLIEMRNGRNVLNRLHPTAARHLSEKEDTIELGCCAVSLRAE